MFWWHEEKVLGHLAADMLHKTPPGEALKLAWVREKAGYGGGDFKTSVTLPFLGSTEVNYNAGENAILKIASFVDGKWHVTERVLRHTPKFLRRILPRSKRSRA